MARHKRLPAAKYDRILADLSGVSVEARQRMEEAGAVGRAVLHEDLDSRVAALASLKSQNVTISAVPANLEHIPRDFIRSWAQQGRLTENLVPSSAPVARKIYTAGQLLEVMHYMPGLDTESAFAPLKNVPFIDLRVDRYAHGKFGIAIQLGDIENDVYEQGFLLQGEKFIMAAIKHKWQRPPAPSAQWPTPRHFVKIAEAHSQAEDAQAVLDGLFREVVGSVMGSTVTLSENRTLDLLGSDQVAR